MRFLLRMTFWLTLVCILLPRGESEPAPKAQLSATDAMSAATATVDDMRAFCERQPEACSVGSQAATVLEERARAGAKRLYQILNERLATPENDAATTATSPVRPLPTGSVPLPPPRPVQRAERGSPQSTATTRSQNTLTPSDLAPAWHGPLQRKDAPQGPA